MIFFNKGIDEYRKKLEECKNDIKSKERKLHFYIEGDYEEKINSVLVSVYNASSIKEIIVSVNNCRLPNLPKGSSDEIKQYKEELKVAIDNLKEVVNTLEGDSDLRSAEDNINAVFKNFTYSITIKKDETNKIARIDVIVYYNVVENDSRTAQSVSLSALKFGEKNG